MYKKLLSLVIALIALGLIVYYITNIYELIAKTYYVNETDLYRIDTFHLQGRAYEESKYSGRFSSENDLTFTSTSGYSFSVADNVFLAIKDKQKLEDTLMYHDTEFVVFSNKENYDNYRKSKEPIFIEVCQIQIGDTKYIDNPLLNKLLKGDKLLVVFCFPLALIFLGVILYKTGGEKQWTMSKINLFSVSCFLVFLLIIVGVIVLS